MEEKTLYVLTADDFRHIACMLERAEDIPASMFRARDKYIETLRVMAYGMNWDDRLVYISTELAVVRG